MEAYPWADGKTVTYRYHPLGKKPISLGTDLQAALKRVLEINGESDGYGTLKWLWEQFTDEKKPAKRWAKLAENTRDDYKLAWKQIEQHLGAEPVAGITPPQIARYVHITRSDSPRRADIEKTLLSNLFKHGILLGVCTINATLGVEPHGSEPSTIMPETAAMGAFLKWLDGQTPQRRIIGFMAEYASLAGNRRVEFLDLTWPQVDRVGGVIRTKRAKQRGKKRGEVIEVVTITPRLAALLDRIKAANAERGVECLYLFPTEDNNCYTDRGFKSRWQDCFKAALKASVVTTQQRFTFHSLRRYYTTMHRGAYGELPNLHADKRTTARVYDATIEEGRKAL